MCAKILDEDRQAGKLRILSHSQELFRDREEAGKLLAYELAKFREQSLVMLGIPRGGLVIARELARELKAELDVILSRKLRTPGHEELAMGSVAEDGTLFLNDEVIRELGVSSAYIEREKIYQLAEIAKRAKLIRRVRPKVPLKGKVVIVTDDGVATGATTQAALWSVRLEQPERLILALPVGPEDTVMILARDADETICLRTPPFFAAVGQFYSHFDPVEDEEMLRILQEEFQDWELSQA